MIFRRTFLGWLSALPFASSAQLTDASVAVPADPPLPDDPECRLRRLTWQFERLARHKWIVEDYYNWTYYGDGWEKHTWDSERPPTGRDARYQHRIVCGEGLMEIEAIDDWYGKLPTKPFDVLFWRAKPELNHETDVDITQTRWRVYSRFAVVPLGELV